MTDATMAQRWFRPPRPHGHVREERSVSFLELFYDLVFVVLIAQLAHTLAGDITWIGLRNFVVVFCLVWIAWINGTLYHDLHGGDDGRSRTYIFIQMGFLVLLAAFSGHAADDRADGRGFAIVYALLIGFIAWQWFDVRRFDTPEWREVAGRYVQGTVLVAVIVLATAFVDAANTRVLFWTAAVVLTLVGNAVLDSLGSVGEPDGGTVPKFGNILGYGCDTSEPAVGHDLVHRRRHRQARSGVG